MITTMTNFNLRKVVTGLIVPVAAILVWQTFASMGWVNPLVLPSPVAVLRKWIEYALPTTSYAEGADRWLTWAFSG